MVHPERDVYVTNSNNAIRCYCSDLASSLAISLLLALIKLPQNFSQRLCTCYVQSEAPRLILADQTKPCYAMKNHSEVPYRTDGTNIPEFCS